jgi:hypothetical protein
MRLSTVCLLCVLFFSSVAFGQHHETGSAPSAPAASPAPSPAPSFSPPPAPSAPSISHSEPSVSAPVSAPVIHSAPAANPSPSPMHSAMPSSDVTSNSLRSAPESKPQSDAAKDASAKAPATNKITSDDHAVETPALKKPPESDIRHPVCFGGKCPEVTSGVQNEQPMQDDLRHCILCKCPPGQSAGKGGCVSNPTNPPTKTETCAAGSTWNGSSCVPTSALCPSGQSWNGGQCALVSCPAGKILRGGACMEDCSMTNARADGLVPNVRSARQDRDDACRQGLGTAQCQQADGHYQNVLAEYRMLWAGAAAECRAPLPVPDTL